MAENILHIGAVRIRCNGSGNLKTTLFSLDDVYSQALTNITLQSVTNIQPTLLANFSQERALVELKTTEFDEHFRIRRIVVYVKEIASSHPQ